MRNSIIFTVTLVVVAIAIYGIFYFVFPETSALMTWCVVSGIAMAAILSANILLVSDHKRLTIKNAATAWVLNVFGVLFFVWTLTFVFGLGSYEDNSRSLSNLYVGYLALLIIGLSLWLMADRGGFLAHAHNDNVQDAIQGREVFLSQLNQIKLNLTANNSNDAVHAISRNIDHLRNVPVSKFNSSEACRQLSEAILRLNEATESEDIQQIEEANKQLSFIIKSLRV